MKRLCGRLDPREARSEEPEKFENYAPDSVEEAVQILESHQGEARVLAGGQSLVPMMNFRLATPVAIVDLNRVAGLAEIGEADGAVTIGAVGRQRGVEFAPLIAEKLPLLSAATRWIGHLPTRTRGTIGGSIAHADPAAEIPMILQVLEGAGVVRAPQGEPGVRGADLFVAPLTTSLAADEIITELRFPAMPPEACHAIEEFARRKG